MKITFGTILSGLVFLIGVSMLALFFQGHLITPPVLSGIAFLLLGIKGMMGH